MLDGLRPIDSNMVVAFNVDKSNSISSSVKL
jgi:hypothetical protein